MTTLRRTFLGRVQKFGERMRVYDFGDGLEVDIVDNFSIDRRRVFFNDVLLITLHYKHSRPSQIVVAIPLVLFSIVTLIIATNSVVGAIIFGLFTVAPFAILLTVLVVQPYAEVTVYGKRSKAIMHWAWRHGRAQSVFHDLKRRVKDAQDAERRRIAARIDAAVSPFAAPAAGAPPTAGV